MADTRMTVVEAHVNDAILSIAAAIKATKKRRNSPLRKQLEQKLYEVKLELFLAECFSFTQTVCD